MGCQRANLRGYSGPFSASATSRDGVADADNTPADFRPCASVACRTAFGTVPQPRSRRVGAPARGGAGGEKCICGYMRTPLLVLEDRHVCRSARQAPGMASAGCGKSAALGSRSKQESLIGGRRNNGGTTPRGHLLLAFRPTSVRRQKNQGQLQFRIHRSKRREMSNASSKTTCKNKSLIRAHAFCRVRTVRIHRSARC